DLFGKQRLWLSPCGCEGAPLDSGTRRDVFQVAVLIGITLKLRGAFKDPITHLSRGAVRAAVQLAAGKNPDADPCADRDAERVVDTLELAFPVFSQDDGVDVVVDPDGNLQPLAEAFFDLSLRIGKLEARRFENDAVSLDARHAHPRPDEPAEAHSSLVHGALDRRGEGVDQVAAGRKLGC